MAKDSLLEYVRINFFLPKFGEEGSADAAKLFSWLMDPHIRLLPGRKLYLNKKGTGEHWQNFFCALVVTLEAGDFKHSDAKRIRFLDLMALPLGRIGNDRDAQIRSAFDGTNLSSVMERFKVSRATVYRAAKKRKSQNSP